MITSNQDKKLPQGEDAKKLTESTNKLVDSIKGVLNEKKLTIITTALQKTNNSNDAHELISEIKLLRETIENNNIREWKVEIERDSRGFISSLRYNAIT